MRRQWGMAYVSIFSRRWGGHCDDSNGQQKTRSGSSSLLQSYPEPPKKQYGNAGGHVAASASPFSPSVSRFLTTTRNSFASSNRSFSVLACTVDRPFSLNRPPTLRHSFRPTCLYAAPLSQISSFNFGHDGHKSSLQKSELKCSFLQLCA